ncbi:hypothetical protein ACFX2J_001816 [Malus domestica]
MLFPKCLAFMKYSFYNPLNDTQLSVSKSTPFDADQRYSRLQRDGLVSRREKSMTYMQDDMQQLRGCSSGT